MANTLYDLLEVSQSASADAIAAGYKRLHGQSSVQAASGDEDATNRLIALREAYTTLSDPARRQRYDDSLAARDLNIETVPAGRLFLKLLLVVAVVGAVGVTYKKHQAAEVAARLETERTIAAARIAESEARKAEIEARQAREARVAADRETYQQQREEARERASRERDIAYGNQVSRNLERAEAEARRQKSREENEKANAERQRLQEAERQLAREKAYLRQVEYDKRRSSY